MKARLRSVRIAPKKANLVAGLVRGLPVEDALTSLERTNKKAARILEQLIKSAMANAQKNDNQNVAHLVVKTLVVNKAQAFHRGVPMARGRVRPMRKFMSHIEVTLGLQSEMESEEKPAKEDSKTEKAAPKKPAAKKPAKEASQTAKKPVKTEATKDSKTGKPAAKAKKGTTKSAGTSARAKKSES